MPFDRIELFQEHRLLVVQLLRNSFTPFEAFKASLLSKNQNGMPDEFLSMLAPLTTRSSLDQVVCPIVCDEAGLSGDRFLR